MPSYVPDIFPYSGFLHYEEFVVSTPAQAYEKFPLAFQRAGWVVETLPAFTELVTSTPVVGNYIDLMAQAPRFKRYRFVANLSGANDYDGAVLIGASKAESLQNLVAAVNLESGAGVKYSSKTTLNLFVSAEYQPDDATYPLRIECKFPGPTYNGVSISSYNVVQYDKYSGPYPELSNGGYQFTSLPVPWYPQFVDNPAEDPPVGYDGRVAVRMLWPGRRYSDTTHPPLMFVGDSSWTYRLRQDSGGLLRFTSAAPYRFYASNHQVFFDNSNRDLYGNTVGFLASAVQVPPFIQRVAKTRACFIGGSLTRLYERPVGSMFQSANLFAFHADKYGEFPNENTDWSHPPLRAALRHFQSSVGALDTKVGARRAFEGPAVVSSPESAIAQWPRTVYPVAIGWTDAYDQVVKWRGYLWDVLGVSGAYPQGSLLKVPSWYHTFVSLGARTGTIPLSLLTLRSVDY